MATEAQIAANRRNAQKSTGPKTPQGKQVSRMNGLRHGLDAETVFLPIEDAEEFAEHRRTLEAELQPVGPREHIAFEKIVVASWRLERTRIVANSLLSQECLNAKRWSAAYNIDRSDALALFGVAYRRGIKAQYRGSLIEGRLRKAFYQARADLELLQKMRFFREAYRQAKQLQ